MNCAFFQRLDDLFGIEMHAEIIFQAGGADAWSSINNKGLHGVLPPGCLAPLSSNISPYTKVDFLDAETIHRMFQSI